jgi:hypothetical protein
MQNEKSKQKVNKVPKKIIKKRITILDNVLTIKYGLN